MDYDAQNDWNIYVDQFSYFSHFYHSENDKTQASRAQQWHDCKNESKKENYELQYNPWLIGQLFN
jgi:hypothetical protein